MTNIQSNNDELRHQIVENPHVSVSLLIDDQGDLLPIGQQVIQVRMDRLEQLIQSRERAAEVHGRTNENNIWIASLKAQEEKLIGVSHSPVGIHTYDFEQRNEQLTNPQAGEGSEV